MSALKLGRIWASAPTSPNLDPGAAKYSLGHVAEIPVFQVLNYINNRYDTNIVSLAERGVFEWGNDVTYNNAALVWDEADGFIYISKVASPSVATRPGLNASQWDKSAVQISRAQYDTAVTNWSNHIANTSNPHALTTEILNTYTKAVINSKVATVQSDVTNHKSNTSNPHGVTAAQVGAVPATGGNYTGLVKHLFASTGIGAASYAASLLTDATGTFMALGANAKIGLDSTKKAVFINDTSVKSNLLIASDYIAAREAVEASYVLPTPDCEVNFRNGLNLLYGNGTVTFTGPAGSRGYLDKSGVAQTAALNIPRFTAQGLYVTNNTDSETLNFPTSLNMFGSNNFTFALDVQSTASATYLMYITGGTLHPAIHMTGGVNYQYRSVVGGVQTSNVIAPVDHTTKHTFVVVSNVALNKTFVYMDGVLKLTINSKQDAISGASFEFSLASAAYGARYLNSFRTWLYPLTPQQVSRI